MPYEVATISVSKSDLLNACAHVKEGQIIRIATIPAGATILTPQESIAEQMMFSEKIEIKYSIDTGGPPPTVSFGVAGADDSTDNAAFSGRGTKEEQET